MKKKCRQAHVINATVPGTLLANAKMVAAAVVAAVAVVVVDAVKEEEEVADAATSDAIARSATNATKRDTLLVNVRRMRTGVIVAMALAILHATAANRRTIHVATIATKLATWPATVRMPIVNESATARSEAASAATIATRAATLVATVPMDKNHAIAVVNWAT